MIDLARGVFMFNGVVPGGARDRPRDERPPGHRRARRERRRRWPSPTPARPRAGPAVADLLVPRHRGGAPARRAASRATGSGSRADVVRAGPAVPDRARAVQLQLGQQRGDPMTAPRCPRLAAGPASGGQILVIFALSLMVMVVASPAWRSMRGGTLRPAARPADGGRPRRPRRRQRLPHQRATHGHGGRARPDGHRRRTASPNGASGTDRRRHDRHLERGRGHGRDRRRPRQHVPGRRRDADSWHVSTEASALAGFPDTRRRAPARSSSRSARSRTTARRSTRPRPTSARRTATCRPSAARLRLDELRDRQRQHERGRRHHRRRPRRSTRRSTYGEYIGQHNNGNHTALFERRRTPT